MTSLTQSTRSIKEKEIIRSWHLIDAKSQVLGRLTPNIAKLLQGKHKVNYVPNLDSGDYVVVINAAGIRLTGKKADVKQYTRYSGYPGGLKRISYETMINKKPEQVVRHAVSGMLPKNKLRDQRLRRLYIYADDKHPYQDELENSKKKMETGNRK